MAKITEDNCVLSACDLFNIEQAFEVFLNHNAAEAEIMNKLFQKITKLNEWHKKYGVEYCEADFNEVEE